MRTVRAVCIFGLWALAGCRSNQPQYDPFLGRTTVPPPATGSMVAPGTSAPSFAPTTTLPPTSGFAPQPGFGVPPTVTPPAGLPATGGYPAASGYPGTSGYPQAGGYPAASPYGTTAPYGAAAPYGASPGYSYPAGAGASGATTYPSPPGYSPGTTYPSTNPYVPQGGYGLPPRASSLNGRPPVTVGAVPSPPPAGYTYPAPAGAGVPPGYAAPGWPAQGYPAPPGAAAPPQTDGWYKPSAAPQAAPPAARGATSMAPVHRASYSAAAAREPAPLLPAGEPRSLVETSATTQTTTLPRQTLRLRDPSPRLLDVPRDARSLTAGTWPDQGLDAAGPTASPRAPRLETLTAPAGLYDRGTDHGWLMGRMERPRGAGPWRLRYQRLTDRPDAQGGWVLLGESELLTGFQDGDFVTAQGRLVARSDAGRPMVPVYALERIELQADAALAAFP